MRSRLEHLTGAVSVGLVGVGSALIGIYDYLPPADRVADFLTRNSGRVAGGAYVGALGTFFLLWFAADLHRTLRERETGRGAAPAVAFAGGVAGGLALAASFATQSTAAGRAAAAGGIAPQEAVALYDLWSGLGGVALPIGLAALVGGTGVASLRSGIFPRWFGWASILVALATLSPVGYFAQTLAVVWILVVSLWLYARGGARSSMEA